MRIAATADLHFSAQNAGAIGNHLRRAQDDADLLIIAGDLTNYGQPAELVPLLDVLAPLRIPIVTVLGNHDYESGCETEITKMLTERGVQVLDGTAWESNGVGFAGAKGFVGGFGRGMIAPFGESQIKVLVQASIDEALKLERAMAQLRASKRVVILHYAPILATVQGEPPETYPYMGTSRLAEVIDRHGADLVVHGHAHHGTPDGTTTAGIPVHNVALALLQKQDPPAVYRVFEI